ncbi:DinB family protein [Peribacillus asahii]|uniref:DinB family protein n=1 Tax=Peribacillus asahii TaxID=228899 RepID=UPI0037FC91AA
MEQLIEQYKQGYFKIVKELEGLTKEQLLFKPSEKSWSIREVIIHISDAELVYIHRMKAILSEDTPILTAFEQDYLRIGIHNQAGQLTFKEIFQHSIEHIDTHIEQIRRVKKLFLE